MLGFLNITIQIIFSILFSYHVVYIFVALFVKEKERACDFLYHNYAVLICARNEEEVIGDLLYSLEAQTYPKDNYEVFVIADNCDDNTADIARKNGATVYERFNRVSVGKGYALEELLTRIRENHEDVFDAFIVFDADNIVKEDYLEQMNISYCKGNKIIAGYINSKNFASNWLSAGYSLFLLKKNRFLNNARYILGLSCAINGTGFLFDKEIVDDWPYHTLTEDIEFTVAQVCKHNKIAYCDKAVLYDEQPTDFKQSFYQRLRWAKGYLQVIQKYFVKLLKGIGEGDFSCYDMLNTILSAYGLSMFSLLLNLITFIIIIILKGNIISFGMTLIYGFLKAYICVYSIGLLTTVVEWKNINSSPIEKILYTFTFPIFIATYVPIAFYALFTKVTWVPIKHSVSISHESNI